MRTPKKRIRLTKAAELFGIDKRTFLSRCQNGDFDIQLLPKDKPGNSPRYVLEAPVLSELQKRGLL